MDFVLITLLIMELLVKSSSKAISRADFPDGFVFGTASSAYQFEGAVNEGNKGASIWDTFTRRPGRIMDFSNADVAVDQYHRFKTDVDLMKNIGMDAYRFSISWSRIFPEGSGELNTEGIKYYNNLIDSLLEKGIQPYVTLYHWDLPQALEDKYNGWLSGKIVKDFENFAFTCFQAFGDRVKQWITFNEPHGFSLQGYDTGLQAPGRCSILGHLFLHMATLNQLFSAHASDGEYHNMHQRKLSMRITKALVGQSGETFRPPSFRSFFCSYSFDSLTSPSTTAYRRSAFICHQLRLYSQSSRARSKSPWSQRKGTSASKFCLLGINFLQFTVKSLRCF